MKPIPQIKNKKNVFRDFMILLAVSFAVGLLIFFFPEKQARLIHTSWNFLQEMLMILPAVMILMGLFSVFVPKEEIVKHLGKTSGVKGIALALFFGALPTGPLYVAFPLAAMLIKKGARISNIIIFLSAWACIKIPQELMELQFMGLKFMLTRLSLTIVFVILMGLLTERLNEWGSEAKSSKLIKNQNRSK